VSAIAAFLTKRIAGCGNSEHQRRNRAFSAQPNVCSAVPLPVIQRVVAAGSFGTVRRAKLAVFSPPDVFLCDSLTSTLDFVERSSLKHGHDEPAQQRGNFTYEGVHSQT
jgi:hypothetical protein